MTQLYPVVDLSMLPWEALKREMPRVRAEAAPLIVTILFKIGAARWRG